MEIRMRYYLTLQKQDGTVYKTDSAKRRRIVSLTWGQNWEKAILKVVYFLNGRVLGDNQGTYHSIEEVSQALSAFTELDLLESLYPPTPNSTHAHIEAPSAMFAEEL